MNELTPPITPAPQLQDPIVSVKNLVIRKLDSVERNKAILKEKREQLKGTLRSNTEYAQLEENIKEAKKRLEELKARELVRPELAALEADIKELNREQRQNRKDISEYLVLYADKTGQLAFFHPNGTEIHIEKQAKTRIVMKKSKKGQAWEPAPEENDLVPHVTDNPISGKTVEFTQSVVDEE